MKEKTVNLTARWVTDKDNELYIHREDVISLIQATQTKLFNIEDLIQQLKNFKT